MFSGLRHAHRSGRRRFFALCGPSLFVLACGGAAHGDGTDASESEGGPAVWAVSLEVGTEAGAFSSVWGTRVDTLYAAGGQTIAATDPTVGTMFRYDGTAWRAVVLPEGVQTLNWVFGVADHRFAVGDGGTAVHRRGDDDAQPWTVSRCGTNLPLWGVWGASPQDVWAVGGDGFSRPPVLCHYDGAQWTLHEIPPLSVRSRALFKVWGTAADDVFAVGHEGVILHYDGIAWQQQESGTELDLIALWGTGPGEILVVGGRSHAVLVRWDGEGWTPRELPQTPGLSGVWMDDDGAAVVVGPLGMAGSVAAGTFDVVPEDPATRLALHAVVSPGAGALFAVGGSLDLSPPYTGVIVRK
jgi:hypothetical protein